MGNFSITPYAILEIPQNGSFYASPYWVGGLVMAYAPSAFGTIENTTLLADGFKSADHKDVINRMRLSYVPFPEMGMDGFLMEQCRVV